MTEVATQKEFSLTDDGVMKLGTIQEQLALADRLLKAGLINGSFKNAQQVFISFQAIKSMNLPLHAINNFYVVNGKPTIYSEVFVGLCQRAGLMTMVKTEWFDEKGQIIKIPTKGTEYFGCMTTLKRRDFDEPNVTFFTLDDKQKAGISNPVWAKYTKDMLMRRSLSAGLKIMFADCLMGIDIAEAVDEVPEATKAESMMAEFSE